MKSVRVDPTKESLLQPDGNKQCFYCVPNPAEPSHPVLLSVMVTEIQGNCPQIPELSQQGKQGNAVLPLNFSSRCFPMYQQAVSKLGNWVRLTIFSRLSTS